MVQYKNIYNIYIIYIIFKGGRGEGDVTTFFSFLSYNIINLALHRLLTTPDRKQSKHLNKSNSSTFSVNT